MSSEMSVPVNSHDLRRRVGCYQMAPEGGAKRSGSRSLRRDRDREPADRCAGAAATRGHKHSAAAHAGPGRNPLIRATEHLAAFLAFPIEFHNPAGLHHEALVLADALGLPATYDAHYLALAERVGCEVWTDDQRLLRQVATSLPFVRWIGDHPVTIEG